MTAMATSELVGTGFQREDIRVPFRVRKSAIANLSLTDQFLFEAFGTGPSVAPTFDLLHRAFEYHADTYPDVIAVDHLGDEISYGELNQQAEELALVLMKQGVGRGDVVCLFVQRSIPMVVGILATLKVGAAYAPQHVGIAPESQLRHVLAKTGSTVVLTTTEYTEHVPEGESYTVIAIDEALRDVVAAGHHARLPIDPDPSDRCFILFTSGTTGPPNGVQVTHRNVCNIVLTEPGNLGIQPGTRVGQILSIAFDMAAWEIFGALGNGGTLVIRGRDLQETAEKVDVLIATPSVLGSIDAGSATNVRTVAVAGEPCPRPLADTWSAFATFFNSCGPTETTIVNTAREYTQGDALLTIGSPTPNNTVYVLDVNRQPLPIGEIGEMWAGGVCVTGGYLENEALTAERYAPDPFLGGDHVMFRTRDLGRWTPDGTLEHFGRTDDQVKVRGFRVELDSVSAVLESIDGCAKAVTLKLDDRNLAAIVSPRTVDPAGATAAVGEALPYYCVPSVVLAMDTLPMTSRGKVDKRALLELARSGAEKSSTPQAVSI